MLIWLIIKNKEMMKKLLMSVLMVGFTLPALADDSDKFSPEKFQAEMEHFIAQEAKLNSEEATKFFPLLREMHAKQRNVYNKIKKECKVKSSDDAECRKAVQKRDIYELELKAIQQTYHNKFLKILQPSKVYDAIKAEDRFHRRAFKKWGSRKDLPSKH